MQATKFKVFAKDNLLLSQPMSHKSAIALARYRL
jgi:hypothetical protein